MAAALGLSTPIASAFGELIPQLVGVWLQHNSKAASSSTSSSSTASIPDLATVQSKLKPILDVFAAKFAEDLASEAAAKEGLGFELRKYLTDRIVDELESTPIEHVLAAIYACCDVALLSSQAGLMEVPHAFNLIEETADMLPITACSSLWKYAEVRRSALTEGFTPGRGTALGILRTSNELLRRISKSNIADASLGGRVLGLVSEVFPLDDKAGRNPMGMFNISNVTKTEDARRRRRKEGTAAAAADGKQAEDATEAEREQAEEAEEEDDDESNDGTFPPNFYDDFWALQRFFANPRSLADPHTPRPSPSTSNPTEGAENASSSDRPQQQTPATEPNSLKYFYEITKTVIEVFKKIQERETEMAHATRGSAQAGQGAEGGMVSVEEDVPTAMSAFPHLRPIPSSSSSYPSSSTRLKRKREEQDGDNAKRTRNSDDMQLDTKVAKADSAGEDGGDDELFFPKFLTGRNLLKYELRDPSFRFHILLQYFILLQYVLSWWGDEKWTSDKVKVAALQRPLALSDDDNQLLRRHHWLQISHLARALQPSLEIEPTGATFINAAALQQADQVPVLLATDTTTTQSMRGPEILRTANQILRREQHWVSWKMNGCEPPIERSWAKAGEKDQAKAAREEEQKALNEVRNKLSATLKRNPGPPVPAWDHALGTAALTRLWERGFPPPVPGRRMKENEEGIEELCRTDGMERLEGMMRDMPTVEELGERVLRADERVEERKAEVREELVSRKRAEWREEREKRRKEKVEKEKDEVERRKKEEEEEEEEEEGQDREMKVDDGEAAKEGKDQKAVGDGDVEMKDASSADADAETKPNGSSIVESTTAAKAKVVEPEAESEPEPKFTISNDELARALQSDEDYTYLDDSRLHASWKYLRLSRDSTVAHWTNLTPSSVVEVLKRVKMAEARANKGGLSASVSVSGLVTRQGSEAVRSGEGTPAPAMVLDGEEKKEGEDKKGEEEKEDGKEVGGEGLVNGAMEVST
ncbi:unnamed protein product [Tilletia controversa]|nr:unnamed protein product [Tilletia controversa]CAD6979101.1 unnamed protein product [Tilletia controversa]